MKISMNKINFNDSLKKLEEKYKIYAPKLFPYEGRFSDTDLVRYAEVSTIEEMVFDKEKLLSVYDATKDAEPMKSASLGGTV